MDRGADRRTIGSGLAALLIAFALFARILVPEGWMPDGAGHLTLCSGSGPMMAVGPGATMLHGGMHHKKSGGDDGGSHPCVFSGLSAALNLPAPLPAPLPPAEVLIGAAAALVGLVMIGHGLAAPPPPPTGPPATF